MTRSFDLTPQIDRLVASGIGRIQRIGDDVYRKLWPATVALPPALEDRFDRALCVDAFPPYPMHTAVDRGDRRETLPVRLLPLPGTDKPAVVTFDRADEHDLDPLSVPGYGTLVRYVLFWQSGWRWAQASPNSAHARFSSDERGLRLNEALHLPLQAEDCVRGRDVPIAHAPDPVGLIQFLWWEEGRPTPCFETRFGMFVVPGGVPSCARQVIPVSTEHQDFFLKD